MIKFLHENNTLFYFTSSKVKLGMVGGGKGVKPLLKAKYASPTTSVHYSKQVKL